MFKRLIWFGTGAASGAAGSLWVQRRIREQVQRFTPQGVREQAAARLRQARSDASTAVTEARSIADQYRKRA